jgi:predicted oxidoreductase (fatty acid repression mutant protein)
MMTEKEYMQRLRGRIEGLLQFTLPDNSPETKEIMGAIETYIKATPSSKFSSQGERLIIDFCRGKLVLTGNIFLVEGYNQFNLSSEFKETY